MKIKKIQAQGFEEIIRGEDRGSGLIAYIAVHSTKLGPSLGGIRMYPYATEDEALEDAKRLAKAMSFKAAASDIRLGGGKAVIIGDPQSDKTPELLKSMAKLVDQMQGVYYAAKDVGFVTEDLVEMANETRYVTGLPESMGGSGDPSPWTSIGVLEGMKACLQEQLGHQNLTKVKTAIQGLGHVGGSLAELIHKENGRLILTDVATHLAEELAQKFGAEICGPHDIFARDADVLCPCALGGIIHKKMIPDLQCKVIAGGANNQLLDDIRDGRLLTSRNILFAPDYVINAGGLINIYVKDILKQKDSLPWINQIKGRLEHIFRESKIKKTSPAETAHSITSEILES